MTGADAFAAYLFEAGRDPLVLAAAILVATFILEDAATIAAAMLAADGLLPLPLALAALFAGIVLGDMGLYGLGRIAAGNAWIRRKLQQRIVLDLRRWMGQRLVPLVVSARFIPGARLSAYTATGLLGLSFRRFTLAASGATALWITLVFAAVFLCGIAFPDRLGPYRWLAAGLMVLTLIALRRFRPRYRVGNS